MSSNPKTCQRCGAPMVSDAPEGLCARCLLSAAVKEPSHPAEPAPNAPTPEEIARHFPQLEIIALLGRGGMGVVYKARQRQLDRMVALKILPPESGSDPQFAERFAREARALARLSHPHIVAVYDFGETDGLFYFLMEYVDGANLRELMRARQITPKEALAIVPRICEALQFAHDEGIMHRDIKPENILIDRKGRVKIADFGLAKLLGREVGDLSLTQAGMSVGTPRYMAPEQMEHPDAVDHRADIYSLGVVFYEMLTGELPVGRFDAPSHKAEIDVRLDEIVLRSLEHDVERRYQHVSEVKSDVEDVSGALGALPASVQAPQSAVDRNRFWPRFAIVIALLIFFVPVMVVLGLFVPACAGYHAARYKGPEVREERSAAADEAGARREYHYRLTAPAGHRLKLWMEIWRDGVPVIPSGFTQTFHPSGGQRLEARVRLAITAGEATNPTASDQMRVEWQLSGNGTTVTEGAWLPLWSKGLSMSHSTWGQRGRNTPAVGASVTLLGLFANNETLTVTDSTDSAQLRTGNPSAALLLKARFEKVGHEKRGAPLWTTGNAHDETRRLLDAASP